MKDAIAIPVTVVGVMKKYRWMKLAEVKKSLSAMDARNVSRVARGLDDSTQTKDGFVEAYIAVKGDQNKMMTRKTGRLREGQEKETWAERRSQFIARHLKEMREIDTHRNGWQPNGEPTRRHLGLMAWAYTPSPKRTEKWLKTQKKTNWREFVGKIKNPKKSIKAAIHRLSATGVHEKIGFVTFSDSDRGLKINVDIRKLPDGEHGFHVHEFGNLAPKIKEGKMVAGLSAGQHYDPLDAGFHGSPTGHGHLGDLPFITVKNSVAHETIYAPRLLLADIENRSIIIHQFGDNYSDFPLPNGGGKSRIAGGIITNSCPYCVNKNPKFSAKKLENLLDKVYDRGFAAWASGGHRPNQTPQSWANARINSFLVGGKTFFTGDQDLARVIIKQSPKLYLAIFKQRTYEPSKPIPSSQRRVIRDSKGRKIPAKYLSGFRGKEKAKRIKEIEKRRDEYASALNSYGDEKNFPQKVMERLYAAWSTDKGKSLIKSPYTKEAHKRGFKGSKKEKAQAALDYYLRGVKPHENPTENIIEGEIVSVLKNGVWIPPKNPRSNFLSSSDQAIINALQERFKSLSKKDSSESMHPVEWVVKGRSPQTIFVTKRIFCVWDDLTPTEKIVISRMAVHKGIDPTGLGEDFNRLHKAAYKLAKKGLVKIKPQFGRGKKQDAFIKKSIDLDRFLLPESLSDALKMEIRVGIVAPIRDNPNESSVPDASQIKWKKGKDFDTEGTWTTRICGKEYRMFRDMETEGWYLIKPFHSLAWALSGSRILGWTKKDATKYLITSIRKTEKRDNDISSIPVTEYIAYHCGIRKEGEDFDLNHFRRGEGYDALGKGIYFSLQKDVAEEYCKYADEPYLTTVQIVGRIKAERHYNSGDDKRIIQEGYQGLIIPTKSMGDSVIPAELVVYDLSIITILSTQKRKGVTRDDMIGFLAGRMLQAPPKLFLDLENSWTKGYRSYAGALMNEFRHLTKKRSDAMRLALDRANTGTAGMYDIIDEVSNRSDLLSKIHPIVPFMGNLYSELESFFPNGEVLIRRSKLPATKGDRQYIQVAVTSAKKDKITGNRLDNDPLFHLFSITPVKGKYLSPHSKLKAKLVKGGIKMLDGTMLPSGWETTTGTASEIRDAFETYVRKLAGVVQENRIKIFK